MNVAIVYDRVTKFGGAEQVLLALHEIWPNAPLFTAVYDPSRARWAMVFNVHPSFMQHVPFARTNHELFPWLTPLAFESFSFDQFDVVISVTSAEAKYIVTKPKTLHICYCLTPTRYLWSGYESYKNQPGLGIFNKGARIIFPKVLDILKDWDAYASSRPDKFVAISHHVKHRIEQFYTRKVETVIYPPVHTQAFNSKNSQTKREPYFLVVSRFVPYKRIDLVIQACTTLGVRLLVIGQGRDERRLKSMAGRNVTFITHKLTEHELAGYYHGCKAFIFAGEEDFGIVAGEAQAAGKPVICYQHSGMAEIIVPKKTGEVFSEQTVDSLINVLKNFAPEKYRRDDCIQRSKLFDKTHFIKEMKAFVDTAYKEYYANNI